MNKLLVAALCVAALAGCSSPAPTEEDAAPAVEVSENLEACESFAKNTFRLADPLKENFPNEPWEELRTDFDMDALNATGDVKNRLSLLVDEWPTVAEVIIYDGTKDVNALVEAVGRACDADGASVDFTTFSVD